MAKKRGDVSKFQKKRRKLNRSKLIILAVILIGVAYFVFSGIKIIHLNTEKAKVEEKNRQLKEEVENLTQQLEAINSPEFIERLARKNLKLVKQGELMFVLPNLRGNEDSDETGESSDNEKDEKDSPDTDKKAESQESDKDN